MSDLTPEKRAELRCEHDVPVALACKVCGENSVQRTSAYGVALRSQPPSVERDVETLYPKQDLLSLGSYYSRHVAAMTHLPGKQEGLHSKSGIAEQLAWRDQAIDRLESQLASRAAEVERLITEARRHADEDGIWQSRYELEIERLLAELEVSKRVSEHRRETLLQWRPEADKCTDCGVHRSLHHPIGPAEMADADCPCEEFVPFGLFAPEDAK